MKVTVKEGIKGFSGNLSFSGFFVPALAVAPNRRNGVRRYIPAGTKNGVRSLYKLSKTFYKSIL